MAWARRETSEAVAEPAPPTTCASPSATARRASWTHFAGTASADASSWRRALPGQIEVEAGARSRALRFCYSGDLAEVSRASVSRGWRAGAGEPAGRSGLQLEMRSITLHSLFSVEIRFSTSAASRRSCWR